MKAFYNSSAVPKKAFGEDTPELHAFHETKGELFQAL